MKKITRIDIAIAFFYSIAIISLFFPYSRIVSGKIVKHSNMREVFFETSNYWCENIQVFFVLGLSILIVVTSFSEKNWTNKIRNLVFSLFALGILSLIEINTKLANYGPIPQKTFFYYSMIFAILSILITATIKTWQKETKS